MDKPPFPDLILQFPASSLEIPKPLRQIFLLFDVRTLARISLSWYYNWIAVRFTRSFPTHQAFFNNNLIFCRFLSFSLEQDGHLGSDVSFKCNQLTSSFVSISLHYNPNDNLLETGVVLSLNCPDLQPPMIRMTYFGLQVHNVHNL